MFLGLALGIIPDKSTVSNSAGKCPTGITVDKSVEFSFEELSRATHNFSLANKIGQGGFGAVYYAELRGEVCFLYHFLFYLLRVF
jgi:chitin elicitor receptor kinase 1